MKRPAFALLHLAIALVASAQSPAPAPGVPALFAGELDDVGPQYLLVASSPPRPWELWADLEITATSNVTLVEIDPSTSTLTVAQAGLDCQSDRRPLWGGTGAWHFGLRGQAYRYGYLSGENEQVNLVEIDRNNFDLGGLHAGIDWQRGPWFASGTVQAATLRSNATDHTFYAELAAEWALFWQKSLAGGRTLALGLEGAMRFSDTDSFGLLPHDWNNRLDQSIALVFDQPLGTHWHLRPTLRCLASVYTAEERDRSDQQFSARLIARRPLGPHAELRLTAGFDHRESTDHLVPDFHKWDLGLGLGGRWQF